MKIPFFPSIGAGDPSSVVALALHELGLSEDFLIRAVLAAKGKLEFKNGEIDYKKIGCFEWFWICKKLYLPLDSYAYGYSRLTHRAAVGEAILDRSFVLPLTARTKALFREYLEVQRHSHRREKEFYGDELLRKVIRKRIDERRERKLVRALNLRVGRPAREKYDRLFVQSSIGAPLMLRDRKRRTANGVQHSHGLRVELQQNTENTTYNLE